MNKSAWLVCLLCIFIGCGPKEAEVERYFEDGIEVVVNHLEPYKIKGEPSQLALEEEVRIDFEKKAYEGLVFRELGLVEADSEGNIYLVETYKALEYFIYKFDKNGNYLTGLAKFGQGPGELQQVYTVQIDNQDRILVSDIGNSKVVEYDNNFDFIKETRVKYGLRELIPLENGNYLARRSSEIGMELWLLDADFENLKKLDTYDLSELRKTGKTTGTISSFYWRVANGRIYVGNEQRGYEIWIFDLDGNLMRKIRKEYQPVEYPEEFKEQTKKFLERMPNLYMMEYTPPFNSFFIDDENRLYVLTYEKGEGGDEYIHDIFNSDGVFIGRKSIGIFGILGRSLNHRWAPAKNGRYYRLINKESGYMELVVYKMVWE
jgi:hypothetical protein